MLSRVADSIYWMARYIERAENITRFIDVNWHLNLDMPGGVAREQWEPLITTTGDHKAFKERYGDPARDTVIQFLVFDRDNPNSIISCLFHARENARSVREMISTEMWESINTFYLYVLDMSERRHWLDAPYGFFAEIKRLSHLFIGYTVTTLMHGEGWHFCRLGRLIERADKTARILDVKYFYLLPSIEHVGTPFDALQWGALLRSASALEAYRKKYGTIQPKAVVEFLILDHSFPRAVHYCLVRAEDSLHAITGTPLTTHQNRAERLCGKLRADLAYTDVEDIMDNGLHEYIDSLESRLNDLGNAITELYFQPPLPDGAVMAPVQEQIQGAASG